MKLNDYFSMKKKGPGSQSPDTERSAKSSRTSHNLVRHERNNVQSRSNRNHFFLKKIDELHLNAKAGTSAQEFDSSAQESLSALLNVVQLEQPVISATSDSSKDNDQMAGTSHQIDQEITNLIYGNNILEQQQEMYKTKASIEIWQFYCYLITFWAPSPLLSAFGMKTGDRQMAWREKIGLLSIVGYLGGVVGFLTFGFTKLVCDNSLVPIYFDTDLSDSIVIHGRIIHLSSINHPDLLAKNGDTMFSDVVTNFGGKDASFLFQNVNGHCHGIITPTETCSIPHDFNENLAWYFPCQMISLTTGKLEQYNLMYDYNGLACHTSALERNQLYFLNSSMEVYYHWEDILDSKRDLVVVNGEVLDLGILNYLSREDLDYPSLFNDLKSPKFKGYDLSVLVTNDYQRSLMKCLTEITKVGKIDSKPMGCIISNVVLVILLTFVFGVVITKFLIACYFRWVIAKAQGADVLNLLDKNEKALVKKHFLLKARKPLFSDPVEKLREPFCKDDNNSLRCEENSKTLSEKINENTEDYSQNDKIKLAIDTGSINGITTMSLQNFQSNAQKHNSDTITKFDDCNDNICDGSNSKNFNSSIPLCDLKPVINNFDTNLIDRRVNIQPSVGYIPNGFPLLHAICFVTCYSEDYSSIRITLDSIATTNYPNSHKLMFIVCDGIVKGHGNNIATADILLSMMTKIDQDENSAKNYSYFAVANGMKRHNKARVYSGYYRYDEATVKAEDQQNMPMILIVKCGTEKEQYGHKPGNRGKRDSQVILMSFLQKITFDERMTELEYNILKGIWKITGLLADVYEVVLMVDADTKIHSGSLTHMIREMVKDPLIMGLCGETKIVNKAQTWVTAIQVFEYFISHHQAKAFESVFGSVTCLPGCFSMYRIKSPKGIDGYWVPILANPDVVEKYADILTDSLHKKNLLLLGEDRFLSSLMLKTFPKRKQIFVPKASCKTVVPHEFRVLLSQRRRWINSTIHNLFELLLIKDLCGTFCFSMQFVIVIELVGTMILPLAICFTIYIVLFSIFSSPTPVITLILLTLILGLPGVIVVVTARNWMYLVWMLVYIVSLPIWNLVLPLYSFWKFDDFTWGETRTLALIEKEDFEQLGEIELPDNTKVKLMKWRQFLEANNDAPSQKV